MQKHLLCKIIAKFKKYLDANLQIWGEKLSMTCKNFEKVLNFAVIYRNCDELRKI